MELDKYLKNFELEISLENYISDILTYTEDTYLYLTGKDDYSDKEDIIMYLSNASESVEVVRKIIYQIEEKYDKEIKKLNEQLQQTN